MTKNVKTANMLTHYNAWANNLIFEAAAKLPPDEIIKERDTVFKNIVYTLNHCYVIAQIWKAHLEGREHGFAARNTKDCPPFDLLREAQKEIDQWYITFSDSLSIDSLNEIIQFTFIGGTKGAMTREEIIIHIINHTSFHRGFVADMFHQIPAIPPTTDLPVFLQKVHRSSGIQ
ncbi:MAG: DinB family protein [Gammaproteobacteria bacterium]